jgi:hypothetical protein
MPDFLKDSARMFKGLFQSVGVEMKILQNLGQAQRVLVLSNMYGYYTYRKLTPEKCTAIGSLSPNRHALNFAALPGVMTA